MPNSTPEKESASTVNADALGNTQKSVTLTQNLTTKDAPRQWVVYCGTCGGRGVVTVYDEVHMDSFGTWGTGTHQVDCPDCNGGYPDCETGTAYNRPMTQLDASRLSRLLARPSFYNTGEDWDWLAGYGVTRETYRPGIDLGRGASDGARYFWRDASAARKLANDLPF